MSFKPSEYQKDIYKYVENEEGSLFIEAVAGAGKTVTLLEMAKLVDTRQAVFLAFNRHIADELKAKLPPRMMAMTLHQLGKQEWEHKLGTRPQINNNKVDYIIDERILKDRRFKFQSRHIWKLRGVIKNVVSRAKMSGMQVEGGERFFLENNYESWNDLISLYEDVIADKLMLDITDVEKRGSDANETMEEKKMLIQDVAMDILRINAGAKKVIDFDDMLYFPYIFGGDFFELDFVFCDEVQDFSPLQIEIVKMCIGKNTRIFGVGDRRQGIYSWRSADAKSIDRFISMFECKKKDLPVTYRCPKNIVTLAQKYNPEIMPWEKSGEGLIEQLGPRWKATDFKDTDFILGRNNAPVLAMALQLIHEDIKVQFVGKDVSSGIERIINRIDEKDKKVFINKLEQWYEAKAKKLKEKVRPTELTELIDQYFCLRLLISKLEEDDPISKCLDLLREIFNSVSGVRLSTIHRSKGLESDRVFILDFEKFDPLKKGEEKESEEMNLAYVGITRAKQSLHFIDTPGWFKSRYYTDDGKTKASEVDFSGMIITKAGAINKGNADEVVDKIADDVLAKHHPEEHARKHLGEGLDEGKFYDEQANQDDEQGLS
jgi:DNA helicase-2/ATP-dependent DNA helicase PcrA